MMKFGSMNAVWSIHSEYWIHNLVSFAAKLCGLSVNFWAAHTKKNRKNKKTNRDQKASQVAFAKISWQSRWNICTTGVNQSSSSWKVFTRNKPQQQQQRQELKATRSPRRFTYANRVRFLFLGIWNFREMCGMFVLASVGWTLAVAFCGFLDWIKVPQEDLQREWSKKYFLFYRR